MKHTLSDKDTFIRMKESFIDLGCVNMADSLRVGMNRKLEIAGNKGEMTLEQSTKLIGIVNRAFDAFKREREQKQPDLLQELREALESVDFECFGASSDFFLSEGFKAYNEEGKLYVGTSTIKVGPITSITVANGTVYGQQHCGSGFANVFEVKGNDTTG